MMNEPKQFSDEQLEFVTDLLSKATVANEKTKKHSNVQISIGEHVCYLRVDDKQLLDLGIVLLPNVLNYLVNVLPTLIYPYIIAYLQDLSDDDQPITVNDLYDLVSSINFNE